MNLTKSNAYRNLFLLLLLNVTILFNAHAQQLAPCTSPTMVTWMSAYLHPVCPMKNGTFSITLPASVSGAFKITVMYAALTPQNGPAGPLQPYEGGRVVEGTKTAGTTQTFTFNNLDPNYYCVLIQTTQGCFNNDIPLVCCPPIRGYWAEAKRHPMCGQKDGMIQYRISNDPNVNAGQQVFGQVRLTLMYRKLGTNDPLKPYPGAQIFMHDFGTTQENRKETQYVTFNNLEPNYYCAIVQTYQGCYNIDIELTERCNPVCTYTQGAWGSEGGKMSDGLTGTKYSTVELINRSLANWGGKMRIGSQVAGGRSLAVTSAQQVLDFLPNGGPSFTLTHSGELSLSSFLSTYNKKNGGSLIAQAITLGLNLRINMPGDATILHLADVPLEGIVNATVISKLTNKTVGGLYEFANRVIELGTSAAMGLSLSDIADALDAVNNFFDGCGVYRGPGVAITASNPGIAVGALTETLASKMEGLKVVAGPNPFRGRVQFQLESAVSGQGVLEVYNAAGVRLATPFRGYVAAGKAQTVNYASSSLSSNGLLYVFRVNGKQTSGKLIAAK